jgi:hypothetical protein
MNKHQLLGALLLVLSSGCAAVLQQETAKRVGCPASEVKVWDDSSGMGESQWKASCGGKTYQCSNQGHTTVCEPLSG